MPANLQQDILRALRDMLARLGRPDPGLELARYVLESHVTPELPLSVHSRDLVPGAEFGDLMHFLEGGPDWIHANLYLTPDGEPVIGLSRGRICGNPSPSLNISIDPQLLNVLEDDKKMGT